MNKSNKHQTKRFEVGQNLGNGYSYRPSEPEKRPPQRPDFSEPEESRKKKRRISWKCRFALLFLLLLTPFLIIGIWDMKNAADASEKLFGTRNVAGALLQTPLKNTDGRTNILLVGYSADDPGHAGAELTDSIMVVSLDKDSKTGYMLSIPRDLYVDIPEYGYGKINEAYQAGKRQEFKQSGYFDGGPGLLQKTITDNFGMPIDYYVVVNYGAVKGITDALGGITVNIESTDPDGLYDPNFKPEEGGPLKLANGQQEIDGQTALRLTRARGSTYGSYGFPQSDLNRVQNQQKVFAAIKQELTPKLMIDPRKNKPIFDALAANLETNLKLSEVIPIYRLISSVPDQDLKSINLADVGGVNYLTSYRTRSGQSALVPAAGIDDFSEIQALVKKLNN